MGINTGELVKSIRADKLNNAAKSSGYGIAQACFCTAQRHGCYNVIVTSP